MNELLSSVPFTLTDGVVAAIFLLSAFLKGKRGLYKSLMPLIVTLAAVIGAAILSRLLAGAVTTLVYPLVEKSVFAKLDLSNLQLPAWGDISGRVETLLPLTLVNFLGKLGIDFGELIAEAVRESAGSSVGEFAANAAAHVLLRVTAAVVRFGLFLVCVIVLLIVLKILKNALGLVVKLPVIHWVDKLGGAALGLIECAVTIFIVCWLLGIFAPETIEKLSAGSKLLTFFI